MVRGLDWVQKVNGYEVPDNRASGERSACQSGNGALLRAAGLTAKAATQRVRLSPVSDGCSATIEIYPACSGTRLLLKEIRELLSLRVSRTTTSRDIRERAEAKIVDIDAKIRSVGSMKRALRKLTNVCEGCVPVTECPILESLDSEDR